MTIVCLCGESNTFHWLEMTELCESITSAWICDQHTQAMPSAHHGASSQFMSGYLGMARCFSVHPEHFLSLSKGAYLSSDKALAKTNLTSELSNL